jgi:hypothetical protein
MSNDATTSFTWRGGFSDEMVLGRAPPRSARHDGTMQAVSRACGFTAQRKPPAPQSGAGFSGPHRHVRSSNLPSLSRLDRLLPHRVVAKGNAMRHLPIHWQKRKTAKVFERCCPCPTSFRASSRQCLGERCGERCVGRCTVYGGEATITRGNDARHLRVNTRRGDSPTTPRSTATDVPHVGSRGLRSCPGEDDLTLGPVGFSLPSWARVCVHRASSVRAPRRPSAASSPFKSAKLLLSDQGCRMCCCTFFLSFVLCDSSALFSFLCSKEVHAKILLFHPPTQASITSKNFF